MSVDRVQRSPPIVRRKHSNGRTTVVRCGRTSLLGHSSSIFRADPMKFLAAVEKLRIKGIRDKFFVYLAGVCQAVLR